MLISLGLLRAQCEDRKSALEQKGQTLKPGGGRWVCFTYWPRILAPSFLWVCWARRGVRGLCVQRPRMFLERPAREGGIHAVNQDGWAREAPPTRRLLYRWARKWSRELIVNVVLANAVLQTLPPSHCSCQNV